MGKQVARPLR